MLVEIRFRVTSIKGKGKLNHCHYTEKTMLVLVEIVSVPTVPSNFY